MRKQGSLWRTALWVSAAVLGVLAPAFAQTHTAALTGVVTSQDGNTLPNVDVVATNVATGVAYPARSNSEGLYTIAALPIGTYKVRATLELFKAYETKPTTLESGQVARVNIRMELGAVEEAIVVTDVAPILQTENAVVGEVVTGTQIVAMPLNGRNFNQLSLLMPGVITTSPDSFTDPKNFSLGRPYVNGQREQANNYMLDGLDMNEIMDNTLPYQPNIDALEEIRVETNNYSAEFGNVAGAIINSTLKSGTNEYSGNVFGYWRDNAFAANSWDNNRAGAEKGDLSQKIFGATLGGPIVKNKVFFFADYQGFLRDVPGEQVVTVAPEAWRHGDFSSLLALGVVIRDPVTGQPFPGNVIPEDRISPTARAIMAQQYYPSANRDGSINNYVTGSSDKRRSHQGDLKIDAALSDNDRVSFRASINSYTQEPDRAALPSSTTTIAEYPYRSGALNWTHTLGPSSLNELLVGYSQAKFDIGPGDWAGIGDANVAVGIPGAQPVPGLSGISFGGGQVVGGASTSGIGSYGIRELNDIKTLQLNDKFSYFTGRHAFKVGGRWLYTQQKGFYSGNEGLLGHFDFTGTFTGYAFSDFLLDQVAVKGRGTTAPPWTQTQHRVGLFVQDDWKIGNSLTLNLGLAWEYTSPLVEKDDRQSNIDLTTGQLLLAGKDGNSRALYDAYWGGFEPRLGFAWTPGEKWVVRGGYGIVQYMEGTGKNLRLTLNPPYFAEGRRSYDQTTGPGSMTSGFSDIDPNVSGSGYLFRVYPKDLRPQFTQQWNLFFEYKLTNALSADIGYVGHHATHMIVPIDFNQPLPDPGPVETWRPLDERRPLYSKNPSIGAISGTDSIGVSNYNALQVRLRQRMSGGLEYLASYTYGKALSDSIGYYGIGWNQGSVQGWYYMDSSHPLKDYGPSPYDARHIFNLATTYELPVGKGRKWGGTWSGATEAFLGNWSLNAIFSARSGLPVTVLDSGGQSLQASRSWERPDRVCSGEVSDPGVDGTWIDINCFRRAPAGRFGDSGVGILRGPGYWNLDLGISKRIFVDAKRYLTLRVEAFNALNHPNFPLSMGNTDISDPVSFGKITHTFSSPRILEFALKFNF